MDKGEFVTFKRLPATSNEAIQGAVWEVWDETFQKAIGVIGWTGAFKTYSFAPYHLTLMGPDHLEEIAEFLRTETKGRDHARDTIFGRD